MSVQPVQLEPPARLAQLDQKEIPVKLGLKEFREKPALKDPRAIKVIPATLALKDRLAKLALKVFRAFKAKLDLKATKGTKATLESKGQSV
jgi:hypothetical protein